MREKPFIELKDSGDRLDADCAAEALAAHKVRREHGQGGAWPQRQSSWLLSCGCWAGWSLTLPQATPPRSLTAASSPSPTCPQARNDSFIVDSFMGLYRSLLICPEVRLHPLRTYMLHRRHTHLLLLLEGDKPAPDLSLNSSNPACCSATSSPGSLTQSCRWWLRWCGKASGGAGVRVP